MNEDLYIPLMKDPIQKDDILFLKEFLDENNIPRLSNGPQVEKAEEMFAKWLGVKYCIAVNSGSSANFITMAWLKQKFGKCSVILPPLTWCSDWYAVIQAGLYPITVDITFENLSFDLDKLEKAIRPDTKAIFLTHVLGLSGMNQRLLDVCKKYNLLLIEDCCETVGGTFNGQNLGTYGFAANWSGFVAHHFSAIELGLITTNDEEMLEFCRAGRSHGMNREIKNDIIRNNNIKNWPEVNPDFIFLSVAGNFRTTEIGGILLQSQIKKIDTNNIQRKEKFQYFIDRLDPNKYFTKFNLNGQCAYSFIVILKEFNKANWIKVANALNDAKIQFRRGCSGGGSQLKSPYAIKYFQENNIKIDESELQVLEHIHYCSAYVGLYPSLEYEKIDFLLNLLNSLDV